MWCRQENSSNELLMKKALVWIIFRMKIETVIPSYFWLALIRFSRNIVLKKHQVDFQLLFVLLSKKWWMIVHGCEKIWNMNWTLSLWANMYVHVRRDGEKKDVMSIFGRSMPNSQICQISFWSGRLFHSIRPTECQFNYSSRVAPKAFPNASESQEAKQAPYFCLPATIFTVIDRISTESRLHVYTSFSSFAVVYMVK